MKNDLIKPLMTARDARIGKPSHPRLTIAIERVNRGDLPGALFAIQSAHQCDQDHGYIHANHAGKPWAYTACRGFENHHQ